MSGYRGGGDRGGRGYGRGDRGRGGSPARGDSRGRGDYRGGGDRGRGRGRGGGGGGIFNPPNASTTVDARLTDNSQGALIRAFNQLKIKPNDLPLRPDLGTSGVPIKLRANYYPIKFPKGPYYEYHITITPAAGTAAKRVKRRIFQLAEKTQDWATHGLVGSVAHDHSTKLIAAKKLNEPVAVRVLYYEEHEQGPPAKGGKEYTLTFKFVGNIDVASLVPYLAGQPQYMDLDVAPLFAALNLVLSAHPGNASTGGVMVGTNKFFWPSSSPLSLGGGVEAMKGFYSSVRPSYNQLMVNVNVCTTAFYTPSNLVDAIQAYMASTFGARATSFAKGVRVRTLHLGYTKTIKTVTDLTPRQHKFKSEEFGEVDVATYFEKKYKIKLKHPNLPLVDVGGQKANLLPPELCEILPKQTYKLKLNTDQTDKMLGIAARPPNQNAMEIQGPGLDRLGFRTRANPLNAFGVSVGTEMTVVPGRILEAPGLQYGPGSNPQINEKASWNLRGVKFANGARFKSWAVLVLQDNNRSDFQGANDPQLRQSVEGLARMCNTSGMSVSLAANDPVYVMCPLPPKDNRDPVRERAIAQIDTLLGRLPGRPSFVLVLLSNSDKHIYSGIKYLLDVQRGVSNVCVQSSQIAKQNPQYYGNVALKINMKMGGVNHSLDRKSMSALNATPTMIVGIDVTHPGPGSIKGTPSIAAVVASVDSKFAQYSTSMELQESKKEMVTNLATMMVERLKVFSARNAGTLPARVLVYRDGVSEGQYNTVINEEMPAIQAAFMKFSKPTAPYNPKLTIVICGKRHHTRFYPLDEGNADQNGNPRPGTVVDQGVTSVYHFDFFLQAHGALQGTARPTHYFVVHNEIGFKADELQNLTNAISYMFARATKAVSLAAPAYFADLACERGRCYIQKLFQGITRVNTNASNADELVMREATETWRTGVHPAIKDSMFYL
ncbi:argonaute-like protein [Lentinula raphanica]|nr:argonaute-like protein [Lentinula raphanica]KAJ3765706.1 argonaute-like protein [Lentinula raphanica]KAJ3825332.1 argonaute-like protein [Lentinula raphanica]KAJ3969704.1 argonaute-like protein [Lentinula raphanica]